VVAQNVSRLRDLKFPDLPNATARNRALAKEIDSTLSQIQRILALRVGTSIDTIEQLAQTFGISPAQLLSPYLAPLPPEPPVDRRTSVRTKAN